MPKKTIPKHQNHQFIRWSRHSHQLKSTNLHSLHLHLSKDQQPKFTIQHSSAKSSFTPRYEETRNTDLKSHSIKYQRYRESRNPYLQPNTIQRIRMKSSFLNHSLQSSGSLQERVNSRRILLKKSLKKKESPTPYQNRNKGGVVETNANSVRYRPSKSVQLTKESQTTMESAKQLLKAGNYRKSLLLLKALQKEHLSVQLLTALNWYHLQDYLRAVEILSNVEEHPQVYRLLLLCTFRLQQYEKCSLLMRQAEHTFIHNYHVTKLHAVIQDYIQDKCLQQTLRQCLQLNRTPTTLLNLALFLQNKGRLLQSLQIFESETLYLSSLSQSLTQADSALLVQEDMLYKQVNLGNPMTHYMRLLSKLSRHKEITQLNPIQESSSTRFYKAYSYLRLGDHLHALSFAQEAYSSKDSRCEPNEVQLVKLLTTLYILKMDLYEANRLLLSTSVRDKQLKYLSIFADGCASLMRNNLQQGLQALSTYSAQLLPPPLGSSLPQLLKLQYLCLVRRLTPMLYAYGYYCRNQFELCKKMIMLQRECLSSLKSIPMEMRNPLCIEYNDAMCEAYLAAKTGKLQGAKEWFLRAIRLAGDKRFEPTLCVGIIELKLMERADAQIDGKEAREWFEKAVAIAEKQPRNSSAAYFMKSVYHGRMSEWREALDCIDLAIERSEDHYWRHYYTRALLLACIHAFPQAVNDCTLAINLAPRPQIYLLRSRCLQLDGNGQAAFKDLQTYIASKPDDLNVHQYVGQLLFENGAFQDAVNAFCHYPIAPTQANRDCILTLAKSHFLLGQFSQAAEALKIAQSILPTQHNSIDIIVMEVLFKIKEFPWSQARFAQDLPLSEGSIFKRSDLLCIDGIIHFLKRDYREAVGCFEKAIADKSIQEEKEDITSFVNQSSYNASVCYLFQEEYELALRTLEKIKLMEKDPQTKELEYYRLFVAEKGKKAMPGDAKGLFQTNNRLSNNFPLPKYQNSIVRLSVPFPKVEPPDIFPTFGKQESNFLSVFAVDRKPQAPWILRQNDSIKFTDIIKVPSKLQLNDSDCEQHSRITLLAASLSSLSQK